MNLSYDQIVAHLRIIRAGHGEESFHKALKGLFRSLLEKPGADEYIQRLLTEFSCPVSLAEMKAEVKASLPKGRDLHSDAVEIVRQAVEQQMPHCKTQAHFDLVLQAWEMLKVYLEAAYGFDLDGMAMARGGLNRLLDLAPQVARAHAQVQETPEAVTNPDYVEPARELTEHHKHATLVTELEDIDSMQRLQTWYASAKPILDGIVNQALRDQIFDAIRAKKQALAN